VPKKKVLVSDEIELPETDISNLFTCDETMNMSDSELCKEVWRRIVREYLEEKAHPTMVLKASELLAKTAGCLYGGASITDNAEMSPVFVEMESDLDKY
jgi:hypothetical protein